MSQSKLAQMINVLSSYEKILEDPTEEINNTRLKEIITFLIKNFKKTLEGEEKALENYT